MSVDSLIVPECIYRPGSFTGLMTIYESNFIKLNRLVRQIHAVGVPLVSTSTRDCELHLRVVRREPYTTTLKLTYLFAGPDGEQIPDPDLTLRVYHDARLVEAVRSSEEHRHHKLLELARVHSLELDRRWRTNMMLNKWLDYLLDMGHGFAVDSTPPHQESPHRAHR